jgi:hypothetical protein
MWKRLFVDHPREGGETWGKHLRVAWSVSGTLFAAGALGLLHGLVPGLFKTAASDRIRALHKLVESRTQPPADKAA